MEFGNKKQGGGGFMKNKLVMSFYRAPKTSSGEYATKVEQEPSWAVHKVSLSKPAGEGGGGGGGGGRGFPSWDDGCVHGPQGISGDEQVDTKATSYICQVKERRRLEELNIIDEVLPL